MLPFRKKIRKFFYSNISISSLLVILLIVGIYFGVKIQKNFQQRAINNKSRLNELPISTIISAKPRERVISYKVKSGDSLVSLGEQFGISVNTIKWANNLATNEIAPGQELKIAPVTGVIHTVAKGETISSVAAKYKTTSQNIKNFIFNEYKDPNTFELAPGQTLYVPEGIKE